MENIDLIKDAIDNKYDIKDYSFIYNKMQDEKSKRILFNRVMYDNTKNTHYAIEMIKNMYYCSSFISNADREMYNYLLFLQKNDNFDKDIYFFGLGYNKEDKNNIMWEFLSLIGQSDNGLNIGSIYDEDFGYDVNLFLKSVCVQNIDDFYNIELSNDKLYVIIDSKYNYIEQYLLDNNISEDNIFKFDNLIIFNRERQYLDEPFTNFNDSEVFVDGGSSNLETTLGFIDVVGGKYEEIYAVEPFLSDYQECNRIISEYNLSNVYTVNCGLWSKDDVLSFNPIGYGSSYIGDDGTLKVECRSIDSILEGKRVSIIKMDIEGSEKEALIGASDTIKNYHPLLMICVYHKPNDVIELANTVFNIRDDYDLYLRHYSFTKNETVLYFVPKK